MKLELDEADEKNLSENHGFIERLEDLTVGQHISHRKMRGITRAENDLAEAVKNAALDLSNLAGFGTVGGSVRFSGDAKIYEIAVEYTSEAGGRFLLETAVDVVAAALNNQSFPVSAKIAEARVLAENDKQNNLSFLSKQNRKIPIVAITGTNGKTTVTRLTAHVLLRTGLNIGTTTTTGILFNGETIQRGDTTGPLSARTVLENEAVDIAVLETARGGIMRRGLGWDWADIAVVTNITEDHIGQDGIESLADLVNVKSLIAERVRENGTLVLNADDAESSALAERPAVKETKKKVVYFAMSEENPILKKQAEIGETAYFVRGGWICKRRGAVEITPIAETTKIPITMGGTADFQIQNAMAVVAISLALNLSPEEIAAGLYSFQNDVHNPGRNNLYRVGAGYVLVDYGHNTDGFAAVSRMARRWEGKTVTAIIGLPGDRDNRIIEEAGRIAARGFDRVIVTEEVNPRGRPAGEIAKLLCDAIAREKPGRECEIVLDEIEAFSKALKQMRKNEVVVMFYRQLDLILEILAENQAVPVSSFDENESTN
jgi:cyanophycin synthetase